MWSPSPLATRQGLSASCVTTSAITPNQPSSRPLALSPPPTQKVRCPPAHHLPKLLQEVYALPRSAWRRVELDVPTRQHRTPKIYEQSVVLEGHRFRQIFVLYLGHEEPTILLTNQHRPQ